MFGVKDDYQPGDPLASIRMRDLSLMAAFLNYLSVGKYFNFTKPDEPTQDTPPCIELDIEALAADLPTKKITHNDITDWDEATEDFAKQEDVDDLTDAVSDLTDVVQGIADDVDTILEDYATGTEVDEIAESVSDIIDAVNELNDAVTDIADVVDAILTDYALADHTHGFITADGKLSNCQSAGCLVVTDAQGRITHSDSKPLAKDVADLVQQWIDNDRKIGGGTITHDKITDWDSATAGFLDGDDYDTLVDAIGELADAIADCLKLADVGVTVAEKNHTHTTANISDWGTATAAFLTDADLAGYATVDELDAVEAEIEALADIVGGILDDYATVYDLQAYLPLNRVGVTGGAAAYSHTHTTGEISNWSAAIASALSGYARTSDLAGYAKTSDLAGYAKTSDLAGYAKTSDLAGYAKTSDLSRYALESDLSAIEDDVLDIAQEVIAIDEDLDDLVSWYNTGVRSATIKVCTGASWNGTKLVYTYRNITVANGLITSVPGSDSSTDIDTPTVISWS